MHRRSVITSLAIAALAGLGICNSQARADGFGIDIRIDVPAPVVVVPVEIVGVRGRLYDADLRFRLAQADEWRAHEALEAARLHEGDVAAALADAQAVAVSVDVDPLRRRLSAAEHRAAGDQEYLKAAEVLHDQDAATEAQNDLAHHSDEAAALRDAIARAGVNPDVARLQDELAAAHEAVYAAEVRLADFNNYVCVAIHDRDEALWLMYGNDILAGNCDPLVCGFQIDAGYFRAHRRDHEAIHAYLVHDVTYWNDHPDLIVERIEVVNRVKEISSIREVEKVKEVRVTEIEKVEKVVKVEDIKKVHESVKVETQRAVAEHKERDSAAKEGRKPNVTNFVADTHPAVADKLRHGSQTSTPNSSTPDTGGRHHDSGTASTPDTGSTGSRHHDSSSSGTTGTGTGSSSSDTGSTGGRHHSSGDTSSSGSTGTGTGSSSGDTGSTGGRHHSSGDSSNTPPPTSRPSH